jgi:CheY-like chemotaxis protein
MTGESILIVEDEGIIALQLTELLENHGYRVAGSVATGEDAVSVAKKPGRSTSTRIFRSFTLLLIPTASASPGQRRRRLTAIS